MMCRLLIFGILVIWLFTNVVNSEEEAVDSAVESSELDVDLKDLELFETDSNIETLVSASILGEVLDRKRKRKTKRKPKKSIKKQKGKAKKSKKKRPKAKGKKPKKSTKAKAKKAKKAKGKKAKSKGKKKKRPSKGKGKKKGKKPRGKKPTGKKPTGKKPTGKKPNPGKKPDPKPGSCKKPTFCGDSPLNSLCKYSKPASGCKILSSSQFKQEVLAKHNEIRQKVASGGYSAKSLPKAIAPGIPDLKWDEGLACLAEAWTMQCIFGHDKERKTSTFTSAGQNAYWSSSTKPGVFGADATVAWFNGELEDWNKYKGNVKKFSLSGVKFVGSKGKTAFWQTVGHLTQVIWAKSTHIGCAQATGSKGTYVVCNYGPAGNYMNDPLYPTA